MKRGILHRMSSLFRGQSIARILMNEALAHETLRGTVIDIGGGRSPNYFDFLQRADGVQIETVDASLSGIDFETDPLPFSDAYADTILLCNVLEHIYEHKFLLLQVHRVLKKEGHLIGFVPFWVGYHPDPHDFFRYTNEALERMLTEVGFKKVIIKRIGRGPILANFNTIVLSVPRIFRPLLFICYASSDWLFVHMRPQSVLRNPLGFLFVASVE